MDPLTCLLATALLLFALTFIDLPPPPPPYPYREH